MANFIAKVMYLFHKHAVRQVKNENNYRFPSCQSMMLPKSI